MLHYHVHVSEVTTTGIATYRSTMSVSLSVRSRCQPCASTLVLSTLQVLVLLIEVDMHACRAHYSMFGCQQIER